MKDPGIQSFGAACLFVPFVPLGILGTIFGAPDVFFPWWGVVAFGATWFLFYKMWSQP